MINLFVNISPTVGISMIANDSIAKALSVTNKLNNCKFTEYKSTSVLV